MTLTLTGIKRIYVTGLYKWIGILSRLIDFKLWATAKVLHLCYYTKLFSINGIYLNSFMIIRVPLMVLMLK